MTSVPPRGRSVEESVHFAVGHWIRVEILAALHDEPAGRTQLAKILGLPRSKLRYHIYELLKDGSIEEAGRRKVGNLSEVLYRITRLAYYSDRDFAALSMSERQVTAAAILEASWAEALASLRAGRFHSDPRVAVIWNRILLDPNGRDELADEQERSWARISEIEATAAARRLESNDPGTRFIVVSLGYGRGRSGPPKPHLLESGLCLDDPQEMAEVSSLVDAESVSRSVGHRIRVEILAALHEGSATASKIARSIGQPLNLAVYHIHELLADGAVRQIGTVTVRNVEQPLYAQVKLPFYSDADWQKLSREDRQVVSAVSIRSAIAEAQSALWAGKFHSDPRVMVAWKPITLDSLGRDELADEQEASWYRICEIEKTSGARLDQGNSEGKMYVVTTWGFKRHRQRPATKG